MFVSVLFAVLPCLKKDDDAPFTSSDISPTARNYAEQRRKCRKNEEDKIADLTEEEGGRRGWMDVGGGQIRPQPSIPLLRRSLKPLCQHATVIITDALALHMCHGWSLRVGPGVGTQLTVCRSTSYNTKDLSAKSR